MQARFTDADLVGNVCVTKAIEPTLLHESLRTCKYLLSHIHDETVLYLLIGCQYFFHPPPSMSGQLSLSLMTYLLKGGSE